jgi:hypothetical protein
MPQFRLKRELKDIEDCVMFLWGPYDGATRAAGFARQSVDFDFEDGTQAIVSLEPGKAYEAFITLFGEREGKIELHLKPAGSGADFAAAGTLSIPKTARKKARALGYIYSTSIEIMAA